MRRTTGWSAVVLTCLALIAASLATRDRDRAVPGPAPHAAAATSYGRPPLALALASALRIPTRAAVARPAARPLSARPLPAWAIASGGLGLLALALAFALAAAFALRRAFGGFGLEPRVLRLASRGVPAAVIAARTGLPRDGVRLLLRPRAAEAREARR